MVKSVMRVLLDTSVAGAGQGEGAWTCGQQDCALFDGMCEYGDPAGEQQASLELRRDKHGHYLVCCGCVPTTQGVDRGD